MEEENKTELQEDSEHLAILAREGTIKLSNQRKQLPLNYMANEFMDQQLTTLNKSKEKKNADNANGNGASTREHLEGNSEEPEDPDSKLRKEPAVSKGPAKGS